ncbi:hypothetical protein HGRIS_000289 [Hohenbuehelia grisea]|uniref:Uncharacterized protein n=1 Tax=Hohenbuehelia grisea TaxID=104357 RepID=A0ABR3JSG7_9AGAR
MLTAIAVALFGSAAVHAKPVYTRASESLLNGDLTATSASIDLLGQCVQELVPPTGAQAAAGRVLKVCQNTTFTVESATTFLTGLNDTLGHLQVTLQQIADAFPAFDAVEQEDDEDFDIDDIPEALGDAGESLDGVFENLKPGLPNADLKAQAKAIQTTNKDIKQALKAFDAADDLVGGNSTSTAVRRRRAE